MIFFLRALRLLSMTVWVGGLIFIAFILAPLAFSTLPSQHEAGTIVGGTLHVLNTVGMVCGLVFLMATGAMWQRMQHARRLLTMELVLLLGMLATTAIVQYSIVPAMERDRIAAGGNVDAAPMDNPARQNFERLHAISEKVEGAALLLGIGAIILMSAEHQEARPAELSNVA